MRFGPFAYFRRRRERESAIPPELLEPEASSADPPVVDDERELRKDPAAPEQEPGRMTLPGADAGELARMIGEALRTGTAQVSTETHPVERGEGGLRSEIEAMLSEYGLSAGGSADSPAGGAEDRAS